MRFDNPAGTGSSPSEIHPGRLPGDMQATFGGSKMVMNSPVSSRESPKIENIGTSPSHRFESIHVQETVSQSQLTEVSNSHGYFKTKHNSFIKCYNPQKIFEKYQDAVDDLCDLESF